MDGIEINEKYVRAFKFGQWPNGKSRWVVGRWKFGDNEIDYIYPENFKSKAKARSFIAKLNLEEREN
jgi:hypothetical protein